MSLFLDESLSMSLFQFRWDVSDIRHRWNRKSPSSLVGPFDSFEAWHVHFDLRSFSFIHSGELPWYVGQCITVGHARTFSRCSDDFPGVPVYLLSGAFGLRHRIAEMDVMSRGIRIRDDSAVSDADDWDCSVIGVVPVRIFHLVATFTSVLSQAKINRICAVSSLIAI